MENMDTSTPGIYYFAVIALGERERDLGCLSVQVIGNCRKGTLVELGSVTLGWRIRVTSVDLETHMKII
jgi:hypothetical protein